MEETQPYYIVDGRRTKFYNRGIVSCSWSGVKELTLFKGVQYVYCYRNKLTTLTIPEGVSGVYCNSNNITNLDLPKDIEYVYCDLKSIDVKQCLAFDKTIFRLYI